jgi:hypothetical protein
LTGAAILGRVYPRIQRVMTLPAISVGTGDG